MIEKFSKDIELLDINNQEEINKFIYNIDINEDNYNKWIEYICSNKVNNIDMNKIPYIIENYMLLMKSIVFYFVVYY